MAKPINPNELNLHEKIVHISRVAKVVKGGRRFSFSSLVVVGDGQGHVGVGLGKANEVPESIRKATEAAKKNLIYVPIAEGGTVHHDVMGRYGAGLVIVKPASPGTGVIAGVSMRAVLESAGYKNVLTKCIRTNNHHNVIKATFNALLQLQSPEEVQRIRRAG